MTEKLHPRAWRGTCMAEVLRQGLTLTEGELAKQYLKLAQVNRVSSTMREAKAYVKQCLDLLDSLGLLLVDGGAFKYQVAYTTQHVQPEQQKAYEGRPAWVKFPQGGEIPLMPGCKYQLAYNEEKDVFIKPLT